MVNINDDVVVWSERNGRFTRGTVLAPKGDKWLIEYEDGLKATKPLDRGHVVLRAEDKEKPEVKPLVTEADNVTSQDYIVVSDGIDPVTFDSELDATHFVIRELRAGRTAKLFEHKVTESYRLIDSL